MRTKYQGVSSFQQKVYTAVCRVPRGRVTTYKRVAEAVGCGSARAVGQALRVNPYAPKVPCHRVIASDHTSGGFQGKSSGSSVGRKRAILGDEGVYFGKDGRLCDAEFRLWP